MDLFEFNITNESFPNEILEKIAAIDKFKNSWDSEFKNDREKIQELKQVATIESIGSSTRIEGSKLSNTEVEELLHLKVREFKTRDEQEVAGYAHAMETVFESYSFLTPTENHIKQMHGELLKHSVKDEPHRGEYKKLSNEVHAFNSSGKTVSVVFKPSSPFETPFQMEMLAKWIQSALDDENLHPIIAIGIFIVVFLAIHPFQDGNGRLSRILTTLLLLRTGYGYVPYSSMESIIEAEKQNYYLALRNTQITRKNEQPNWLPWIDFFVHALTRQTYKITERKDMQKYTPTSN